MSARHILYLTPHQLVAFDCHGGECVEKAAFATEAPGAGFAEYLQRNRRKVFGIVANVPEEGFQLETIPFLQSGDRKTVVKRKINQLFQGTPLSIDISLGFEKSRRKDERLLLLGITNPSAFDPVFKAMQDAEIRLSGLYSLPLLSLSLLERLKIPLERTLLVTLQDGSLRQSFFDKGHLVLSRLSPLTDSSVSGMIHAIGAEVNRFQQYLLSQRSIGRNEPLEVHVPLHAQVSSAVAASLPGSDLLRFHFPDLHSIAGQAGLKSKPADSRCQALFAHLAASSPPKRQFAPAAMRKEYFLWQTSNALQLAGAAALGACLLFTGKIWLDSSDLRAKAETQLADAATMDARYQEIVTTFPPIPLAKDVLRQVIGRYETLQRQSVLPHKMLVHLSTALDASPSVELQSLEWTAGGAGSLQQKLPQGVDGDREILLVSGVIAPSAKGNARQLLADFEEFTRRALGPPDLKQEIVIIEQPFDVTSGTALRSGSGSLSTGGPRRFSLALVRELKK